MGAQIEIASNAMSVVDGDAHATISATLLAPDGFDPGAALVEIRVTNETGKSSVMRLSRTETETFSLVLAKLADDFSARCGISVPEKVLLDEPSTITRNDLLKALLPLPLDVEVNVSLAGEQLAITGLALDGSQGTPDEKPWYSIQLDPRCVKAAFGSWRIPSEQQRFILSGEYQHHGV